MTLNEYIKILQEIANAEDGHRGEFEVVQRDPYGPPSALRATVRTPTIEEIKVATKREQYRKLASGPRDVSTGQKVVVL